jgi:hypothetical protein
MPLQYPNIDAVIAQFEGFGMEGKPATVNNNPGNIIAGDFATKHGATGVNGPFAVFPDVSTGALAQDALVSHYADKGLTIQQLIEKWSPAAAPGNSAPGTQSYVDFVSGQLGVPATAPIITAEKKTPDAQSSGGVSPSWCDSLGPLKYVAPMCVSSILAEKITGKPPLPNTTDTIAGISFARIGAFVLGLILIAGGLFLFKPVQNIVTTGAIAA